MGFEQPALRRDDIEAQMVAYMQKQAVHGVPWFAVSRHMLGLRHAQAGARRWRQIWSDHKLKHLPAVEVAKLAAESLKTASHDNPAVEEKVA
jgi:tRNA-dihydrouridine synthase A